MPVVVAGALPPNTNLFSSPPPNPRINSPQSSDPPPFPPIPRKPKPKPNPALKTTHSRTKYHKPITQDVIPTSGDRSVVVGDSGVSYLLPDAPFPFQFSYSESPKVRPLAFREPAFLPFSPPSMPRPWTGKAPLKSKREKELKRQKRIRLVQGLNGGEEDVDGNGTVLEVEKDVDVMARCRVDGRSREEVLGRPLSRAEVRALVKPCLSINRQVNIGRDGLTHNMLELIHSHWRRNKICKVRCRGVPTVDMDNVCHHLEDKTRGKMIYRVGGVVYLFRGRNYDPRTRPRYPVMLWKPATPVYPKLIQEVPEGLTKIEANEMRSKGKKLLPICKLAKNGIYINLVKDVKDAFEETPLVKIDCRGLEPSDYKKIGAKLKDLVPCILLSFDEEQILIWRGKDWKSRYQLSNMKRSSTEAIKNDTSSSSGTPEQSNGPTGGRPVRRREISSRRMLLLWNKAIETKKALLLDDYSTLTPDALLEKVEELESMSQATEHSYRALVVSNNDEDVSSSESANVTKQEINEAADVYDGSNYRDGGGLFDELESNVPYGTMPVDIIVKRFGEN